MALKAIIETLEGVPEHFHELYTEKGGKYELTGVEGFKTQADIDRVQNALTKERNDHKAVKEKFSAFADLDIEDVRAKLDKYPELEAAATGKLDDAAIAKLVEGRLNTHVAPLKRELDKAKADLSERDQRLEQYSTKERQRAIGDAVRAAAVKSKLEPTAVDDAIMLAERTFDIDEEGNVVTKDGVGVTPGINAELWLTDMQAKRPHWWGPSAGGGAGGSRGGAGGGQNPWTAENWNMTAQSKIYQENATRAEQMAKAAGTTIGGQKPAIRK